MTEVLVTRDSDGTRVCEPLDAVSPGGRVFRGIGDSGLTLRLYSLSMTSILQRTFFFSDLCRFPSMLCCGCGHRESGDGGGDAKWLEDDGRASGRLEATSGYLGADILSKSGGSRPTWVQELFPPNRQQQSEPISRFQADERMKLDG